MFLLYWEWLGELFTGNYVNPNFGKDFEKCSFIWEYEFQCQIDLTQWIHG